MRVCRAGVALHSGPCRSCSTISHPCTGPSAARHCRHHAGLLFLANRRLGISGGLDDLCSLVLSGPYFGATSCDRAGRGGCRFWPASCSAAFCPPFSGADGRRCGRWTVRLVIGSARRASWHGCSSAGCFIGFGTRLADGCTSGHGIFGMSNFERPSLASTLAFMARASSRRSRLPRRVSTWAMRDDDCLYLVLGTVFGFVLSRPARPTTTTSRRCSCSRTSSCTASSARRSC